MTLVITHTKVTSGTVNSAVEVDLADWNATHTLTGVVSPAQGGTGIANQDASTITISGSFGITFTVTATTSLTLPTSGTILAASGLTDNALLRANGTTGVQGSDAVLDDSENLSGIGNITGKAGGITITGGTGSGDDLRLTSTSNATKGTINLGSATAGVFIDEVNNRVALGAEEFIMTVNGTEVPSKFSTHTDLIEALYEAHVHTDTAGFGSAWYGARSRGTEAAPTIVQSGDVLAMIAAVGYDGTDYAGGAEILFEVDGTPGADDMPTRIRVLVSPDGSQTPAEVWRIQQNRDMLFASGSILTLPNTGLHLLDTNASHDLIVKPGSDLTADRTLTITTGDADRTLDISAGFVNTIAGNTGAFTLANGIDNSTNQIQLTAARRTLPTTQVFTSGSGTYTTPANVLWIEIELIGGGGGGAGSGTTPGNGGSGGATTWGTGPLLSSGTASGGVATTGGAGGTPSGGYVNKTGAAGGNGSGLANEWGGAGAASFYGGGGVPGQPNQTAGGAAPANSGAGGGGGGDGATVNSGGGGGAGGFVRAIINSPNATYSYAVGAGGTAGTAGTSGSAGGAGGSGFIQVIEHYGS